MERARKIMEDYPDLRTRVSATFPPSRPPARTAVFFSSCSPVPIWKSLRVLRRARSSGCEKCPGLLDVDTTMSLRKPEVQVSIDRDRASDLAFPSKPSPTRSTCWSAASRSRGSPREPNSTTSGCAPTSNFAAIRKPCPPERLLAQGRAWSSSAAWPRSPNRADPARSTAPTASARSPSWPIPTASR